VLEGLTLTVTAQISADGLVLLNVSPTYASRAGQSKSVDGETFPVLRISEADMMVRVRDGSRSQDREVTIGAISAHEASITAGLEPGVVIERNINR